MNKFWPLAKSSWGSRERAVAHDVIDGDMYTMGQKVHEFETAFARHVVARHAVMTNSGSSANLLMATALRYLSLNGGKLKPHRPEVIVPAIAWSTTYAPFHQNGYRLVVCDIDPLTLNVDVGQVKKAITEDTAAVVGVSILGTPAPLVELRELCQETGVLFLEDNCESLGAQVGGKHCGTFGAVGTYSFFFSHHLNTGEGGMLVTDDHEIRDLAICLRAHGWTRDLPPNSTLRPFTDSSFGDYNFVLPGYNVRPTEIAGAVGLVQLDRLVEFEVHRIGNALEFHSLFDNDSRWTTQAVGGDRSVPFGFTLVFRTRTERGRAALAMCEAGIEHRLITGGSFGQHESASHYSWRYTTEHGTPHADHAHDCGLFVGNHAADLTGQIIKLREILEEVIKGDIKCAF